jgi:hypothetical protein
LFPGDFGLSVSVKRIYNMEGMIVGTPSTEPANFQGYFAASVGGEGRGADMSSSSSQKHDALNSSGEDLSALVSSSLSRGTYDLMSRDSASRGKVAAPAQAEEISVVAGTAAYAPPLSTGSFADDLYSVGIVFFELLHVFKTSMERAKSLRDLRSSGTVPDPFRNLFPRESALIEKVCVSLHISPHLYSLCPI